MPPTGAGSATGWRCSTSSARSTRPGGGGHAKLTAVGRQLTRLPIDPRLGRMVLEAGRLGCRRRGHRHRRRAVDPGPARASGRSPAGRRREPRPLRRSHLGLPRHAATSGATYPSSSAAAPPAASGGCASAEFLHYLRVREWQDLVSQLRRRRRGARSAGRVSAGSSDGPAADPDAVHQALLAGLLSHIGMREGERREYLGARGTRFAIFPGSALVKKPPAVGDGRRARGDLAAVGSRRRAHRTRVGRCRSPST